jgi:hypothetical protein
MVVKGRVMELLLGQTSHLFSPYGILNWNLFSSCLKYFLPDKTSNPGNFFPLKNIRTRRAAFTLQAAV